MEGYGFAITEELDLDKIAQISIANPYPGPDISTIFVTCACDRGDWLFFSTTDGVPSW